MIFSARSLAMQLRERIDALDRLTDAKFVTHNTLLTAQERQVEIAMQASQTAIDKAERDSEKSAIRLSQDMQRQFEALNHRWDQQRDALALTVPRAEFEQFRMHYVEQHVLLRDQHSKEISDLKGRLDRAEGRSGGFSGAWGIIVAVVGIAIAIGALVFRNM